VQQPGPRGINFDSSAYVLFFEAILRKRLRLTVQPYPSVGRLTSANGSVIQCQIVRRLTILDMTGGACKRSTKMRNRIKQSEKGHPLRNLILVDKQPLRHRPPAPLMPLWQHHLANSVNDLVLVGDQAPATASRVSIAAAPASSMAIVPGSAG
jgi:hypothetical protein